MLAGDRAADFDAQFKYFRTELFCAFQLTRYVRVEHDEWMQIAVARMKHVGAAQLVFRRQVSNRAQHARQLRARNRAVHTVVIRRNAARRGERVFASAPVAQALIFVLRDFDVRCASAAQHFRDARHFVGHFFRRAIAFAQQNGFGCQVVTRMHKAFDRDGRDLVHHFQTRWNNPRSDDRAHRRASCLDACKRGHCDLRELRLRRELHGHFGHDSEQPFGADHEREQVVATGRHGVQRV